VSPPPRIKQMTISEMLNSIVQVARVMGVPTSDIRAAYASAGGTLLSTADAAGEHEDGGERAGGPPFHGGPPQPQCEQQ